MKNFASKKVVPSKTAELQTAKSQERKPVNLEYDNPDFSIPKDFDSRNPQPSIELQLKKPLNNELYNPKKQIYQGNYNNEVNSLSEEKKSVQFSTRVPKTTIERNAQSEKLVRQPHLNVKKENSFEIDEFSEKKGSNTKTTSPVKIAFAIILGSILIAGIVLIIIGATGSLINFIDCKS